jgi:hypothetical protein
MNATAAFIASLADQEDDRDCQEPRAPPQASCFFNYLEADLVTPGFPV